MKKSFAIAIVGSVLLCAPVLAAEPCLQQSQIYNWDALNDRTLIVENMQHQKFKLNLMVSCQHLQFHQRLGFKTYSNTALACLTRGDNVISGTEIGPQMCPIKSIEAYTPDMEKADKAAAAAARDASH